MSYVQVQKELVDQLRERGVHYQYDDRLSPFWLSTNLPKLFPKDDWLADTLILLNMLVDLRVEGEEPAHESGKYV